MTKSTGVGRGGRRAGAGRKVPDGAVLVGSASIGMDEDTERVFYELGNGNYGVGARRAIMELLYLRNLQSTAKPRGRVGTAIPTLPKLREVSETSPTGGTYNMTTLRRLRAEAKAEFDEALLAYHAARAGR